MATEACNAAWDALEQQLAAMRLRSILSLFDADPARVDTLTLSACGLTLDHSKQRIDAPTLALFDGLAEASDATAMLARMRAGEVVNVTEGRAAMHTALRGASGDAGANREAAAARAKARELAQDVVTGARRGATGEPFDALVHVGIGGSDLGPRLVADALKPYRRTGFALRFAANVDGAEISDALEGLNPARTLLVVVSKTFTTQETMANANYARAWLEAALGDNARSHVIGVSAAPERAEAWGAGEVLPFWDWVGGRYSLWSSVGVSADIALRPGAFDALLDGAAAMDRHVFDTPPARNLAFRAAYVQTWNRMLGAGSYAMIPYGRRLQLLAAWAQQLEMESNGKSVDADGRPLPFPAAAVTWGEPGTNAQHSFFQLLHQGRETIPLEFLVVEQGAEGPLAHRNILLANALAQAQALLQGKTAEAARAEMLAKGESPERAAFLAPHRAFAGDRPSTMLSLARLDPQTLGALLAFYEHRTAIQAWLMGVNPFDQWGVELGKQMTSNLLPALEGGAPSADLDPSTAAWVARLKD